MVAQGASQLRERIDTWKVNVVITSGLQHAAPISKNKKRLYLPSHSCAMVGQAVSASTATADVQTSFARIEWQFKPRPAERMVTVRVSDAFESTKV
jgi:hypothetical protein